MAEPRYLLDTSVLDTLVRQPRSALARRLALLPPSLPCTSVIVACELRYAAGAQESRQVAARIDELLQSIEVLPLPPEADRHYAEIRLVLEGAGVDIGPAELLIAAHARSMDAALVTTNVRTYGFVPDLRVEHWEA